MERLLLGTAVSLAMVAAASAADWPPAPGPAPAYTKEPPPVYSWTGFYLGGDVGIRAAVVDPSVTSATLTLPAAAPPGTVDLINDECNSTGLDFLFPCPSGTALNHIAPRIGIYGGHNWQLGPWVVIGLESDFGYANKSGTLNGAFYPGGPPAFAGAAPFTPFATGPGDASFAVRTTWDASARVRTGVLVAPNVLLYGTGGMSWLHAEATSSCPTVNPLFGSPQICGPATKFDPAGFTPAVITNSTTRWGLTAGVGTEAAVWGNWLLRSEYRYANYGTWANSDTRTCTDCIVPFNQAGLNILTVGYQVKLQTHTAMLGLGFKF
jgi:outer membrane immunogenic protein